VGAGVGTGVGTGVGVGVTTGAGVGAGVGLGEVTTTGGEIIIDGSNAEEPEPVLGLVLEDVVGLVAGFLDVAEDVATVVVAVL
jgi:hypothetical protein